MKLYRALRAVRQRLRDGNISTVTTVTLAVVMKNNNATFMNSFVPEFNSVLAELVSILD